LLHFVEGQLVGVCDFESLDANHGEDALADEAWREGGREGA